MSNRYKFNEDKYLKEVTDYVMSTYGQHYAKFDNKVQTFELICQGPDHRGLHFCTGNAMKYVDRYGSKGGYERKDLLKAIHYLILALYAKDRIDAKASG